MNPLLAMLHRGGPQTKKAAYLAVIVAGIVWLSIGLWIPIRPEWNVAFALLLGAVTTGYVGGKKVGVSAPSAPGDGPVSGGCVGSSTAADGRPDGGKSGVKP